MNGKSTDLKVGNKRVVKNIVTSFLSWGVPVALSFLATPIILKFIGKDAFGVRGILLSIAGYFALFDLGLNSAGTKYISEFRAKSDNGSIFSLLNTSFWVYFFMGILGGCLLFMLSGWLCTSVFKIPFSLVGESVAALRISAIGFFGSMIIWWASAIPTGLQRYDIYNWLSIVTGIVNIAGNVIAAYFGWGLIGIALSNVAANLVAVFLYYRTIRRILPEYGLKFHFDTRMFRKVASFGIYMIGFSFFAVLFTQLDKILIGIYMGAGILTFYIVPLSIANINQQVNGKIMQVFFPMASSLNAHGKIDEIRHLYLRAFNFSLLIGLSVSIPLIGLSYPTLAIWISTDMANNSQWILIILVISFLMGGIVPYNIVAGMGYPQYFTYSAMISGISSSVLLFLLIGRFGAIGAAFSKLGSMAVTMIYYLYVSKKRLGIKYRIAAKMSILPVIIASILCIGLTCLSTTFNSIFFLALYAVFSVIIFWGLIWKTGQINAEEKGKLLQFINDLKLKVRGYYS